MGDGILLPCAPTEAQGPIHWCPGCYRERVPFNPFQPERVCWRCTLDHGRAA